jgi:hypothetical protein
MTNEGVAIRTTEQQRQVLAPKGFNCDVGGPYGDVSGGLWRAGLDLLRYT